MNKSIQSLYIHIPFCTSICSYCDFTKLQYFRFLAIDYLSSLKQELDSYFIKSDQLKTIYIGGGTPTVLDDDLFIQLMEMVKPYCQNIKEFTIESNPESLTLEKLKIMKKYGVNRLSIGVESTDDKILKAINRKHTYKDVIKAVSQARELGFNNINIDLILGLPNVSEKLLQKDIEHILELNPEHISCYSLTVSPNTLFYINNIKERSEDEYRNYYDLVDRILKKHSYIHYEISNWAKENYYALHNLTYWKDEEYFGIGLGASGYINHVRYTNTKSINKYLKKEFIDIREYIDLISDKEYYIMLNLRTVFGLNLTYYKKVYGEDFYLKYQNLITKYINKGYMILKDEKLSLTYEGMMILDSILVDFFSE